MRIGCTMVLELLTIVHHILHHLLYFIPHTFRLQKSFLNGIELEGNIAQNEALCENIFMMVVCIELRIPLFVIGKPGSSKSLAKSIVQDCMQGNMSKSFLFKKFKQVNFVCIFLTKFKIKVKLG